MQLAQRFQQKEETKTDSNIMAFAAGRGQTNNMSCQHYSTQVSQQTNAWTKSRPDNRLSRYPHPSMQSAAWATKWLIPKNPCSHWAMDCPRKSAGKPPIEDPKKRDATFKYHKSKFVSHPTLVSVEAEKKEEAKSMSIQATTEDSKLVLIDSGATHHVAGYCLLFITYKKINLELSVAKRAKHPVLSIGTIKLCTQDGELWLCNALHCEDVPRIVMSLGRFHTNNSQVDFRNDIVCFRQNKTACNSIKVNNRWLLNSIPNACCNKITLKEKNLMSTLFHDRLEHVSMRTVRLMKKHMPFILSLQQVACTPGDVIAVDIMGPLPLSVDKFLYAMVIIDHFSSLVAFIPLKAKSEAAKNLKEWLVQFANIAHTRIKRVNTDNGGEFKSSFLLPFFKERVVVHERTIPYEHHQNSNVEQTNRTLAEAAR
ncbi:hypothetical protein O181_051215 [Austropuccinia psidii MF-1]|uniref:Integrase catalytic domain-containing protein n=1 Tax=Austropuccinia psidii MF-1 TaxID=1389203 RepID=A0A9Q3DWP9_9BASI|nr:hypothetical protein [Austropuccinia psidii MF-1]